MPGLFGIILDSLVSKNHKQQSQAAYNKVQAAYNKVQAEILKYGFSMAG